MDFEDTPQEAAFRKEARDWLATNGTPRSETRVRERTELDPKEELKKAQAWQAKKADAGYAFIQWPEEYGGRASTLDAIIFSQEEAAYATPAYLRAFVASNERVHRWIRPSDTYAFEALFDAPYDCPHAMEVQLTLPDVTGQLRCAERGMGFVMLPCIMADANPLLVRFSNLVHRSDIWMLAHKDSRNNRRMQLFREFLVDVFRVNQHRLNGETAQPRLAARPTADAVGER